MTAIASAIPAYRRFHITPMKNQPAVNRPTQIDPGRGAAGEFFLRCASCSLNDAVSGAGSPLRVTDCAAGPATSWMSGAAVRSSTVRTRSPWFFSRKRVAHHKEAHAAKANGPQTTRPVAPKQRARLCRCPGREPLT